MTDTTNNFDPIPRLQQIAAAIMGRGACTFDSPATAAYYIECAIKEIERLRKERDEARRIVCGLDADLMEDQRDYARHRGWDCFDITPNDIESHEVRGDVDGTEGAD